MRKLYFPYIDTCIKTCATIVQCEVPVAKPGNIPHYVFFPPSDFIQYKLCDLLCIKQLKDNTQ